MIHVRTLTKKLGIVALSATVAASGLTAITPAPAAQAAPSTGLVISEAYGGGGNGGAKFNQDFIELYNFSDCRGLARRRVGLVLLVERQSRSLD